MRTKITLLTILLASLFVIAPQAENRPARAQGQSPVALNGKVTSQEEGAMEGVVVSAKKAGSTITVSVVSDQQGHFGFPANRLEPGHYVLAIRAVGYDLDGPGTADLVAHKTDSRRSKSQQNARSRRSAHQRGMADEHSRHGRAEDNVPFGQLHKLPHARKAPTIDAHGGRIRPGDNTHEKLFADEPAHQTTKVAGE